MIINKTILSAFGVCGGGYDKFVELFGDGDAPYEDYLDVVTELEVVDPVGNKMWVDFVRTLPLHANFYTLQGLGTLGDFRVFNPLTGQYVITATEAEAVEACDRLKAEYIAATVNPMFSYAQALVTPEGNELWLPKV